MQLFALVDVDAYVDAVTRESGEVADDSGGNSEHILYMQQFRDSQYILVLLCCSLVAFS